MHLSAHMIVKRTPHCSHRLDAAVPHCSPTQCLYQVTAKQRLSRETLLWNVADRLRFSSMRSMLRGLRPPPARLDCGSGNTVSCGLGGAGSTLAAAMAAAIEGGTNDGTYLPPGFLAGVAAATHHAGMLIDRSEACASHVIRVD